jgi:hypothetical protein
MSAAGTAAGPNSCRVGAAPGAHTGQGCPYLSPCWHDGTERPIHRPPDSEAQQDHYRGKKKCHTVKNLLVLDETCPMCFLSATYEGKIHDNSAADLAGDSLPHGSWLYQDMGFQGFILTGITIGYHPISPW